MISSRDFFYISNPFLFSKISLGVLRVLFASNTCPATHAQAGGVGRVFVIRKSPLSITSGLLFRGRTNHD
jgi:hypothetical protein